MPQDDRDPPKVTANDLKKYGIEQRHRTIRIAVITAGIVACTYFLADAVVKIMERPWWEAAAAVLIACVGAGVAQTPLLLRVRIYVRNWTKRTLSRQSQIESMKDPHRTSSGMREDGTDPSETP